MHSVNDPNRAIQPRDLALLYRDPFYEGAVVIRTGNYAETVIFNKRAALPLRTVL